MKFIKKYKGMAIYKLENGNYIYTYYKVNISEVKKINSKEFTSIRQCKAGIEDFK